MEAVWHSHGSVTISYRKPAESALVRRVTSLVCGVSTWLIASALIEMVFISWRQGGAFRPQEVVPQLQRTVPPATWWSTANWLTVMPQPNSLMASTNVAEKVVDIWCGVALTVGWALIKRLRNNRITEEQLFISEGLGIQVRWLRGAKTQFVKFIPIEKIAEVSVVEAFQNSRVITILAFLLKGPADLVVPFRHCLPHEEDLWVIQDAAETLLNLNPFLKL